MSMNDASSPYTPEGEAFWRARYKYYFEHCNGAIRIINHFNPWRPAVDRAFRIGKPDGIQPLMIIAGHINPAGQDSKLEVRNGVVFAQPGVSDEGFVEGKPWDAPECSEKRIQHEIGNIKAHLANNAKPGEPLFIVERGWISTGARTPSDAVETMKRLKADKSITRNLHFVTPGQLAATFVAYQQSERAAAAQPTRLKTEPTKRLSGGWVGSQVHSMPALNNGTVYLVPYADAGLSGTSHGTRINH
jgi:hypothetical protein